MELGWKEYNKHEEEIIRNIEKSDYISFDLEMTGIENEKNNMIIDTPQNRYYKYKLTSEKYSIIQLGLSTYKLTSDPNIYQKQISYDCHSYCLYLFPNVKDFKEINNDEIILELKCMIFNRKSNIDFDKWINEGIFYMNDGQYRELYKNIVENNINSDDFFTEISHLDQKTNDYMKAEEIIKEVKENFIDKNAPNINTYMIETLPKFVLYYIKQKLPKNLYYQEARFNGKWHTFITKFNSQEEKERLFKNDILTQLNELNYKKGAKKIFDAICSKTYYGEKDLTDEIKNNNLNKSRVNKKKLIGHNLSLDLLFLISKLGRKLPEDYLEFKKFVHENFGVIYDTKFLFEKFKINLLENIKKKNMCDTIGIKDIKSVLDNMYPFLKSRYSEFVKIKIKPNENLFKDSSYHNAGFDSFVTGSCFLYMKYATSNTNFLEINKNRIFLMNSIYEAMNLDKESNEDDLLINVSNPEKHIYIIRGAKKVNNLCFEDIFGKKLWCDSVTKILCCEKYNIIVVFTNFVEGEDKNENKIKFQLMLYNKQNSSLYTGFTLGEFRKKYMKK